MNESRARGDTSSSLLKSLFVLTAVSCLLAGCASAPKTKPTDAVSEPASEAPQIVEIQSPTLLPLGRTVLLPLPEPASREKPSAAPPVPGPAPSAQGTSETAPPKAISSEGLSVPAEKSPPASPVKTPSAAPAAKPAAPSPAKTPPSPPAVKPAPAAPVKPAHSAPAVKPAPAKPVAEPPAALPPAPGSTVQYATREAPIPARSVESNRGTSLELAFPGSGWVYLGETAGREGVRYDSRRFDGSSAIFLFSAEKEGDYVLRFQMQDPVTGEQKSQIIDVKVREPKAAVQEPASRTSGSPLSAKESSQLSAPAASAALSAAAPAAQTPGSVAADGAAASPAASQASPGAAAATPNGASAAPMGTLAAAGPPTELPSTPDELLRFARTELAASRIASTLEALDKYVSLFPYGSDEAFYLYAKAYEQNTPYRDIKKAYGNYKIVRDEWPRSPFWKESADRIAYIERLYFDIR